MTTGIGDGKPRVSGAGPFGLIDRRGRDVPLSPCPWGYDPCTIVHANCDKPDLTAMTEDESALYDEAHATDKEWITAWSYWDYVGQEYVEWTDREILLNIGKLLHGTADAAAETRSFHLGRLERMLGDYWGMKTMVQKELKDRYTALPEWVERENREASGWEKGT